MWSYRRQAENDVPYSTCRFSSELSLVQLRVDAFLGYQLTVGSSIHDSTIL